MNHSEFLNNFRIYFCSFKKTIESGNLDEFSKKRLRTTVKKFPDNRSKQFAITTQTFFNKRDFQKLEKNLKKFICIRTN